ncbi:MAG: hypothetical protein ABR579_03945 [Actinomycetota bacterium]
MKRALCGVALALLVCSFLVAAASARPLTAQKRRHPKPLFDLPFGYYVAAGAICIGIGAAGGVAYAGIMGPKRAPRPEEDRAASSEIP